jgi:hypothetical protein
MQELVQERIRKLRHRQIEANQQVVETKDGNLQLPISVNSRPLTAKEKQQANLHIQKLVHNPGALRKSLREESDDTTRTQRLLKMLPEAFNFSYGDRSAGDLVKLKFSPNPHFRPPSREAQVFHAMEVEMTVDTRQKRLAELSGHLIQEVKFGGGLLGHLDKGGQFNVKQEQVSPGVWELTVLNVQMKGKALFFKTIAVQQKALRSDFRRISDNLTLAEAAGILHESASGARCCGSHRPGGLRSSPRTTLSGCKHSNNAFSGSGCNV